MSGPWERYADSDSKPWERYAPQQAASGPAPFSFAAGLADPVHGGAQLLTKLLPASVIEGGNRLNNWLAEKTGLVGKLPAGGVDQQVREREAAYQEQRKAAGETGFDWWRLAGNVVNPVNLALGGAGSAATLGGRMLLGGATGAGAAALQPVTDGDFTSEKTKQLAAGGVFGAATPAVVAGVGRLISPNAARSLDVQTLVAEGVRPTVGQTLGGRFNAAEEKLMSVPFIGDAVRNARERGAEDLQRAVGQRALAPIGLDMPAGLKGRDAVGYVRTKLSDAYEALLPSLTWRADGQFAQQVNNLRQMVNTGAIKPEAATAFNRVFENEILGKMGPQNAMTGQTFKAVESNLGQQIARLGQSTDADQRLLGDALKELRSAMRSALERTNPQAPELKAINAGWANFTRMNRAASYIGAADGAFNAAQLQSAVKALDRSKDHGAFARGKALMQDLSDPAKNILGAKVPNSGTTDRALFAALPALAFEPMAGAGLMASSLLYSSPAQGLLRGLVSSRPSQAETIRSLLNQSAPMLGPTSGLLGLEMLQQ